VDGKGDVEVGRVVGGDVDWVEMGVVDGSKDRKGKDRIGSRRVETSRRAQGSGYGFRSFC
jgi:hypothetical protein